MKGDINEVDVQQLNRMFWVKAHPFMRGFKNTNSPELSSLQKKKRDMGTIHKVVQCMIIHGFEDTQVEFTKLELLMPQWDLLICPE